MTRRSPRIATRLAHLPSGLDRRPDGLVGGRGLLAGHPRHADPGRSWKAVLDPVVQNLAKRLDERHLPGSQVLADFKAAVK